MRDPYLYDDVDILRNRAEIKDKDLLRHAEADITKLTMLALYSRKFSKFDTQTLSEIHANIFSELYEWAGEFRSVSIIKQEDILGGDTVRYAHPKAIKKELASAVKELAKLKRTGENDKEIVFKLVRIIASIWQTHPFREGNTRAVIVFAVLFANSLGFDVNHDVFKENAAYVRNALVWSAQGIYSKHEYLERIFFDAILDDEHTQDNSPDSGGKYDAIGEYNVKEYVERPHEYVEE